MQGDYSAVEYRTSCVLSFTITSRLCLKSPSMTRKRIDHSPLFWSKLATLGELRTSQPLSCANRLPNSRARVMSKWPVRAGSTWTDDEPSSRDVSHPVRANKTKARNGLLRIAFTSNGKVSDRRRKRMPEP